MVASLEEYVAQATQAYQPAKTAVQNQINALSGQLDATNEQINRNYAQQQAGLNRQRNMAAETASLQAAGSGGSFGGSANIANRKYYDQSFVPAVTQLRSNQTNELAAARQANESQRTALNSQLANLDAQANQEALRQYWAAKEEEENRRAQLAAARASASSPWAYLPDGYSDSGKGNVDFLTWVKNYSNYNDATKNTLLNGLNATNKMAANGGRANNMIANAMANKLQNSVYYKQYLNWRNS